jgi:hypothetical protein
MLDPPGLRRAKRVRAAMIAGVALLTGLGLSMVGLGEHAPTWAGPLALVHALTVGGGLAGVYLLASFGLGVLVWRWVLRGGGEGGGGGASGWLVLALGPGGMFALSHGLGMHGLMAGEVGRWVAVVSVVGLAVGFLVWLGVVFVRSPNLPMPPGGGVLLAPSVGLLLLAAANPPGWLWMSEGRNYDSLSYHLPLAQEWAARGRIGVLEHNVYSALPSYVEAAFTHIAVALGGGLGRVGAVGLLAHDGAGALATQYLHAATAVLAAVVIGRVVYVLLREAGLEAGAARLAGSVGGAVAVAVPWVTVVSSLSYNESAVNLMFAGALLAAVDRGLSAGRKGLACGVLVGLAVGCKPTAAFWVTPMVGVVMLAMIERRGAWARAVLMCTVGGVVAVAMFLGRNWLATGNPIFPAGSGVFGAGHWSAEQVARFAAGHRETAPLLERIGLLIGVGASGGAAGLGGQPRGMFHAQWSVFFPAGLAALALASTWSGPGSRGARVVAWSGAFGLVAGLVWWVGFSHAQSRFLLPAVVPLGVAVGLALGRLAALERDGGERLGSAARLGRIGLVALPLLLGADGVRQFLRESGGYPNLLLIEGVPARSGEGARARLRGAGSLERARVLEGLGPEAFVNLGVDPAAGVYLLGDATPFYYTRPVVYHTTWDRSPLGEAMRESPGDTAAWARALRKRGIEYVLVSFAELGRLRASGWLDPALSEESVDRFLRAEGDVVRTWPGSGHVLLRLRSGVKGERAA